MRLLKNIWVILLIIGIVSPMLIFLNPFVWGMRRAPQFIPSARLENVIERMKKEVEEAEIDIFDNTSDVWYFRDCENKALDSLDNFRITLSEVKNVSLVKEKIKKYKPLIERELNCKCYDSLVFSIELEEKDVPVQNDEKDLVKIYSSFNKIKEEEKNSIGFKIKSDYEK
jgi:hypothetical protein